MPTAAPVQCSASAARFDSFSTWTGIAEPRLELRCHGNALPAEIGREDDGAARLLDEPGHGNRDPDRTQALARGVVESSSRRPREPVEHGPGRGAPVLAKRPLRVADGARQVFDRDGDVVDVHLEADPDDDARELERHARSPDAARRRGLARLAQELEVDQLRDEARDGSPRETGLRRDLGTRARAGRGDMPEDDAEVGAPNRRLVGR